MAIVSSRTLVVWPNPFHHLDHKGRAACAVRLDPAVSGGERRYIGARLKSALLEVRAVGADERSDLHDLEFHFALKATKIVDTHYHRDRIREGALIAGDEATARAASSGGVKVEFVHPAAALAAAREAALEAWHANHPDVEPGLLHQDL